MAKCAGVAAVVLAVSACTSSTSGPATARLPGTAIAPAALAARLASGLRNTRTVHIDLAVDVGNGQHTRISADEELDHGKPAALEVRSGSLGLGGPVHVVVINGKTYAQGPGAVNPTGKPWVLITRHSTKSETRELAQAIDIAMASVSPAMVTTFARAATAASHVGPVSINARPAQQYDLQVDVGKLPTTFPGDPYLQLAGGSPIPLHVYLDQANRPLRASSRVDFLGQSIALRIDASRYDAPVMITAPPPADVGKG